MWPRTAQSAARPPIGRGAQPQYCPRSPIGRDTWRLRCDWSRGAGREHLLSSWHNVAEERTLEPAAPWSHVHSLDSPHLSNTLLLL